MSSEFVGTRTDIPKYEFVDGPPPANNLPLHQGQGWVQKLLPALAAQRPGEWIKLELQTSSLPSHMKAVAEKAGLKIEVTTRARADQRYTYIGKDGKAKSGMRKVDVYLRVWPADTSHLGAQGDGTLAV